MESHPASSPPPVPTAVPRALSLLILLLMGVSVIYGAAMAIRYLGKIGV